MFVIRGKLWSQAKTSRKPGLSSATRRRRRQVRRSVLKALIFLLPVVSLAITGEACRKHYQLLEQQRCLDDAQNCIRENRFREADLLLRQAIRFTPQSSEAISKMAELLELQGRRAAVLWRNRAAQLQPGDATTRLDWAETAVKLGDFALASRALEGVDQLTRGTARYHKLAGALAWNLNQMEQAEAHYREAIRLEPTSEASLLNLATIQLRSRNEVIVEGARLSIEQGITNSTLRTTGLRQLITYEIRQRAYDLALNYSKQLLSKPGAKFADQLEYLGLLYQTRSPELELWLAKLKQTATNSVQVLPLGRWMAKVRGPGETLAWVESLPEEVRNAEQVSVFTAECCVALRDWRRLLDLIKDQNWGEAEAQRLALSSLGFRLLGEEMLSREAWQQALKHSKYRFESLSLLAKLTTNWGWRAESAEATREIANEFPAVNPAAARSETTPDDKKL